MQQSGNFGDMQVGLGRGGAPVIIMQRLSSSFRAALSGPCSASRVLAGLWGPLAVLLARDRGDLPSMELRCSLLGVFGDAGVLPAMLPRLAPSMSTCSNTNATACGQSQFELHAEQFWTATLACILHLGKLKGLSKDTY